MNVVDILTPGGEYVRALASGRKRPVLVHVRQTRPDLLSIELSGAGAMADRRRILTLLRRMLGVDRDLTPFYGAARRIPWLRPLLKLGRGVRPPRYPTLWEACVKVVLFQQISLQAASTITRRLVEALGTALESEGVSLYTFPSAERVLGVSDAELRSFGISPSKAATLRRVGEAIGSGSLSEEVLEGLPSPEAARVLDGIKGIGPWSATVILLRGLGRLDVFPMNDTSVAHNLELVGAGSRIDVAKLMEQLGEQRGMLYYYLLLARLESAGEVGGPARRGSGGGESA
jgi:DNA-3-methyladenine glycosylase II